MDRPATRAAEAPNHMQPARYENGNGIATPTTIVCLLKKLAAAVKLLFSLP